MENPGFDPGASRLQSAHSTDWANPPFGDCDMLENYYKFKKNNIRLKVNKKSDTGEVRTHAGKAH